LPADITVQSPQPSKPPKPPLPLANLMPFDPSQRCAAAIPFAFDDYLELVDSVGRVVRPDKRGAIPEKAPAILERLMIDPAPFVSYANGFFQEFGHVVGTPASLKQAAARSSQNRCSRGDRQGAFWSRGGLSGNLFFPATFCELPSGFTPAHSKIYNNFCAENQRMIF